jgi:hypothetical protein
MKRLLVLVLWLSAQVYFPAFGQDCPKDGQAGYGTALYEGHL